MEAFIKEEKVETPAISLDKEADKFEISGKSFPEETKDFYEPVLNWLEEYAEQANPKTNFHFKLDYYNSSTSTMILEMLYILERINKVGKEVKIHWYYQDIDDDMKEAGEEFAEMIDAPFAFIPLVQNDKA